jgi:hypothetical protein
MKKIPGKRRDSPGIFYCFNLQRIMVQDKVSGNYSGIPD